MNKNRDFDGRKKVEQDAAWMIAYIRNCTVTLTPEMCAFDYIMSNTINGVNMISALVEFRSRPDVSPTTYPDVVLNTAKVDKINQICDLIGIEQAGFIVQWEGQNNFSYADIRKPLDYPIENAFKRNQTERDNDRPESVYHIPRSAFTAF